MHLQLRRRFKINAPYPYQWPVVSGDSVMAVSMLFDPWGEGWRAARWAFRFVCQIVSQRLSSG